MHASRWRNWFGAPLKVARSLSKQRGKNVVLGLTSQDEAGRVGRAVLQEVGG